MMEPAHAGASLPRGFLRVGGATLARHQLALAMAAGCERIVCLARQIDPDLIELQHIAERAGLRFHVIPGSRGLSGIVAAQDELLVLAEGLAPAPGDALGLLAQGPVVLALPAETAIAAGFERIDINHASAGLMLLPARLVDRLNELPADAEPVSALLRIALQSGVAQRLVPQAVSSAGRWLLVRSEEEAHSAEQRWMSRYTGGHGRSAGQALAAFGVRRFGPALLHAGSGGRALALGGWAGVCLALGLAWFGFPAVALGLLAPAWVMRQAAGIIETIQSDALGTTSTIWSRTALFGWLFDAVLVGVLLLAMPLHAGDPVWQRLFEPVMLVGLLRLAGQVFDRHTRAWLDDRMIAALLLCVCAGGALLPLAVPLLAVLLLGSGLISCSFGLTRA